MLHVRLHHGVIAVLLHVGILALYWGSKAVTPNHTRLLSPMGAVTEPPLPQRLVVTLPALPGEEQSAEGDAAERLTPIDYAAATPQHEPTAPVQRQHECNGTCGDGPGSLSHRERAGGEGPQRLVKAPHPNPLPEGRAKTPSADTVAEEGKEGASDASASASAESAGRRSPAESPDYGQYLQKVLAPALEPPSLDGMRAPAYVVQGLDDGLVQDMVRVGHARLVVQVHTDFFVYEEVEGHTTWRRIAALPGYAQRALRLRSTLSLALAQRIHQEYGFGIDDIAVLVFPSVALDRLILAKQILAAQQLGTPLAEIRVTEGYLRRRGQAFTFLVERARLTNGMVRSLEDGELRFLRAE